MAEQYFKSLDQLPEATRDTVTRLCQGLAEVFGDDLAAVWLYGGSLFGPVALDVDLHILLARAPGTREAATIRRLHAAISQNRPWEDEFDSWYILLEDARRPEPPANVGPWNPGFRDGHWALHRAHWLAGACIVVHGVSPSAVVPPPTWDEIASTLYAEMKAEAREGGGEGRAASPYWTLQLCRVLASLETGEVVRSKVDSGTWALERLPEDAQAVIKAAMRYYARSSEGGDQALIGAGYPDFYALVRRLIDAAVGHGQK
jgi:hypothetical protein